jgi:hypothetical protein
LLVDDYLSEIFGAVVEEGAPHLYRPTIAVADRLFTMPKLDAICYPSVATQDYGINVCMLPARADAIFMPSEAWMIELGKLDRHPKTNEPIRRIHFRLRSREIGADGMIQWGAPGEGINQETIRGFVRRRIEELDQWPAQV